MFWAVLELTDYISHYRKRQSLEKILSEKQIIGLKNQEKLKTNTQILGLAIHVIEKKRSQIKKPVKLFEGFLE